MSDTPLDGAAILDSVVAFIRRFVVLTDSQLIVIALWVAHSHAPEAVDITPFLAINSAEKRCGKTKLLEVLKLLVRNPWLTGRVTAAVLIRKVHAECPTLLLDESDAAFAGNKEYSEALRGVLNSGHSRDGLASCCVGQGSNITYQDFRTFCCKAIAGIGRLPDTVADRSIPIRLKRRAPNEKVARFRQREARTSALELHDHLAAWAKNNLEILRDLRPALPDALSDRQQDGA